MEACEGTPGASQVSLLSKWVYHYVKVYHIMLYGIILLHYLILYHMDDIVALGREG